MVRIKHPRAAMGKTPPARVAYAQRGHAEVDDAGYFDVPEQYAPSVKNAFARKYDVEYDDGEVILPDDTTSREDEPPDESDTTESAENTADKFDLEAFLDESYGDRADAVAAGDADGHLDELEAAETSETVKDAIAARRDELQEE